MKNSYLLCTILVLVRIVLDQFKITVCEDGAIVLAHSIMSLDRAVITV